MRRRCSGSAKRKGVVLTFASFAARNGCTAAARNPPLRRAAYNADHRRSAMTRKLWLVALCVAPIAALAQQPIRIGMINVTSGQFADAGVQLDNGVKTYVQKYGDMVGGRKIEIIRRDVGGVAPDVAKRLAQELIVRDKVDILTGFLLN